MPGVYLIAGRAVLPIVTLIVPPVSCDAGGGLRNTIEFHVAFVGLTAQKKLLMSNFASTRFTQPFASKLPSRVKRQTIPLSPRPSRHRSGSAVLTA